MIEWVLIIAMNVKGRAWQTAYGLQTKPFGDSRRNPPETAADHTWLNG